MQYVWKGWKVSVICWKYLWLVECTEFTLDLHLHSIWSVDCEVLNTSVKFWICSWSVLCVLEGFNVSVKCSTCIRSGKCVFDVMNFHWIYIEFTFKLHLIWRVVCAWEVLIVPVKCCMCFGSVEYVWEVLKVTVTCRMCMWSVEYL